MSTSAISQTFADAFNMSAIGMLFSWITRFFGGTIAQTFYYFQTYPKDKLRMKLFVVLLFILDVVKEVTDYTPCLQDVLTAIIGRLLGTKSLQAVETSIPPGSIRRILRDSDSSRQIWVVSVNVTGYQIGRGNFKRTVPSPDAVQWAPTNRHIVTRNQWIRVSLIVVAVRTSPLQPFHLVPGRIQSVAELVLNICISLSLIFILHGAKSGSQTSTGHMISVLITYVVNRGLSLFVIQFLELVLAHNTSGQLGGDWASLFYYPSSTIHINTTLIVLNNRRHIRDDSTDGYSKYTTPLSEFEVADPEETSSPSRLVWSLLEESTLYDDWQLHSRYPDTEMQLEVRSAGQHIDFATNSQLARA
ncbi:hypothetical protein FOMPIDRAFT_113559 [Fomitopsis schrenkii]|uniref:DUF6534 domain-containing protein n=1 Tax=Fomitopsis schrenkii TaxID=2126942 RepID=S8FNB0_FOMSC|nr:hypothetical protein FOMPIDRAFT_113559 [Fomitopsis schrenkii]